MSDEHEDQQHDRLKDHPFTRVMVDVFDMGEDPNLPGQGVHLIETRLWSAFVYPDGKMLPFTNSHLARSILERGILCAADYDRFLTPPPPNKIEVVPAGVATELKATPGRQVAEQLKKRGPLGII